MSVTLYQFFHRQIEHGFGKKGIAEPATVDYVSDVLTRFAHTSALYPLSDSERSLESVAQFLMEHQRAQETQPPDHSRQVLIMRHLGEYTLFMCGLFRERLQAKGQLRYYRDHGRSAFWQSADFEHNPGRARVFRRLYFDFERVSNAIDYIRTDQFPLASRGPALEGPLTAVWRL
ncbi:MAG: hypothetical protein ACYCRH_02500 [Acidiferrobacteraceae bacterium]